MPNYLEINKNLLFQSASSAGTTIVGVNGSDQLTVTDNNGVTTVVGQDWAPYTSSYKVCTSKLTQITEDEFSSGYLTIGKTYSIKIYNSGDDFSNVADVQSGIINTADCIFVATGTTPTNWTNASSILDSRYPVPTIDENTLGFTPYWKRLDTGTYYFNFSQSVAPDKIVPFVYPNAELNVLSTYEVDSQGYTFLDLTFNTSNISSFDGQVRALAAQPDGKVIVGGNFNHYAGETIFKIARLNSDGTLDTSFIYGGEGGFNNRVRKIVVQDDGKVLVGGDFTLYNDASYEVITECSGITRLTTDGHIDPDFLSGHGFGFSRSTQSGNVGGGNVYDIVVQPDGKILVGGWFSQYDDEGGAHTANRIIRLDASGSIDADFDSGDGFSNVNSNPDYDRVSSVALQPDGNIICAGQFDTYVKGSTYDCSCIIKLDSSGSVDTTFYNNIGTGFGGGENVVVVRLQSDGKIVAGGYITSYNGATIQHLTRLNSDGTLDTDFNSIVLYNGHFNDQVNDLKVLPSGQIVAVGRFSQGFGGRINSIIKIGADGRDISGYDGGVDVNTGYCFVLETLPYGELYVGGDFSGFGFKGGEYNFTYPKLVRIRSSFDVVLTARNTSGEALYDQLSHTPVEIRQYI